jgi:hypothetical protein
MAKRTGSFWMRHVVHHLVVGALQEGRVDGAERLEALGREPAAKVTPCCSAMPTSKLRSGKRSANLSRPVPDGIAAVMATIFSSASASAIRLGEDGRVGGALATGLDCLPVTTSNFTTPWYLSSLSLGRRIALALLGDDMDEDRPSSLRRGRSSAPAADGRDCARRPGRHSRSRARRTACRRPEAAGEFLGALGRQLERLRQVLGDAAAEIRAA